MTPMTSHVARTPPSVPSERRRLAVGGLIVATALGAAPARAGLGESAASVSDDGRALNAATVSTSAMPSYDRHEIRTADGTSVREFAARDGNVFAVDFDGPTMPDLKSVLGTRYDSYVRAAQARRGNHHVVSFTSDGAVVTIVKLPRGFAGHAHLPAAVPTGVDVRELR